MSASACASATNQNASSDVAATPEQAAVGYDKLSRESLQTSSTRQSDAVEARFVCPDATIAGGTLVPDDTSGPARYSAHATKVGSHWKVTVDVEFDEHSGDSVYEVQRHNDGYCVSATLPGPPLR